MAAVNSELFARAQLQAMAKVARMSKIKIPLVKMGGKKMLLIAKPKVVVAYFEGGILQLGDSVWVDATEFEQMCKPLSGESLEERIARLEQALELYQGDFLPDERYEEWTQVPREFLSRLHREVAFNLAD